MVGSYDLRQNTKLEVTLDGQVTDYILSFEDDDNMVWSIEVKGKQVPSGVGGGEATAAILRSPTARASTIVP